MDKIAKIIRDYAVEYDGDDQGEITAKQIRQQIGRDMYAMAAFWGPLTADQIREMFELSGDDYPDPTQYRNTDVKEVEEPWDDLDSYGPSA